jgi:hypothetical protein
VASSKLSGCLCAYETSTWKYERDAEPKDPAQAILWRLLKINNGNGMSPTTFTTILGKTSVAVSRNSCADRNLHRPPFLNPRQGSEGLPMSTFRFGGKSMKDFNVSSGLSLLTWQ